MKVTIKGIVHEIDWGDGATKQYVMFANDQTGKHYTAIGPVEFEYEIPDGFDPRPAKIAAIDAEIAGARASFAARIAELQNQRSRLLAITMEPA